MTDLLFVGRPAPEKGLADLLLALHQAPAGWRLHIAGELPPAGFALLPSTNTSCIREYGTLRNYEIAELMRRVEVVVVPSRYENFGNVALEGMATGRVVIAARTGGMIDLIIDGVTGVHFPPGDVHALSQRLSFVISGSASVRSIGVAARQAALAYSWVEVSRTTSLLLKRFF